MFLADSLDSFHVAVPVKKTGITTGFNVENGRRP